MKASLTWMNEYVPVDQTRPAQELADALTQAGIPVEEVQSMDPGLKKIYTGKIVEITKHPDADKLQVCQVECLTEDGEPITKQIVTAATNVAVGQVVPVAYHKSRLADGTEIKKGKLRGEVSDGMFCSVAEFGLSTDLVLPEEAQGIYIFPEGTPIGQDIKDVLMLNDTVYEFELTANRADCFSMIGLSREFGVMTNQKALFPVIMVNENGESIEGKVDIEIEAPELCTRFMGRLVTDVTVAPSPLWMQNRLRNSGIRPINNVVDVTNYVMLEFGQPLHAFDYEKLASKEIYVRRAKEGEVLTTLDEQERKLTPENLVITNGDKAVALAGVMGGANSQITEETKTIAIESAIFKPVLIRRTANQLNLRSEASSRYEKGVNYATAQDAADLAAQLMAELGGGTIVKGTAEAVAKDAEDVVVETTIARVNGLIGTDLNAEDITSILGRLDFEHTIIDGTITANIPPRRWDIRIPEDLIEEIARIYGYNNIPVTLPVTESTPGELTADQKATRRVRELLEGSGLQEAISYSLTSSEKAARYSITKGDLVSLQNPMSEERVTLAQNLVSGLVENARYNRSHQVSEIGLYEVGHVFYKASDEQFDEYTHVAGLLTGESGKNWLGQGETLDFYTIKGLVEALLANYAFAEEISYVLAADRDGMHPGRTADIYLGDVLVGYVGQLHPSEAKANDLDDTFVFELSLELLVQADKETITYTALNRYPGSSRDIALLVNEEVTHQELAKVISENSGEYLQNIHLFDLYAGDNIEAGKKSVAYSLYFANPQATLKEEEINTAFEKVKQALIDMFDVEVR